MSIISVNGLTKSYKGQEVLRGVDFQVEQGAIYALLGSNGAGKTTTINILATLLSADEGKVTVAGYDVRTQSKKVKKHISLTGQYAAIDDLLTGQENMYMMGSLNRVPTRVIKTRTAELLKQFDLQKAATKRVSTYSGGMRRKLDLAISLLVAPSVIFLDDPTTGLDPRSRQELWRVIRQLAQDGTTILLTTQYLDEADNLADRIGVLDEGKIVAEGTAVELKRLVGGEVVELVLRDKAECEKAARIIPGAIIDEENHVRLAAPLSNQIAGLRNLLDVLANARIEPQTLNIRKPTLDDVFMKLTDRSDKKGAK